MPLTVSTESSERLEASLAAARFWKLSDGFWYPIVGNPAGALVRVKVDGAMYRVERRRGPNTVWYTLAECLVADFDEAAFVKWAETWELAN